MTERPVRAHTRRTKTGGTTRVRDHLRFVPRSRAEERVGRPLDLAEDTLVTNAANHGALADIASSSDPEASARSYLAKNPRYLSRDGARNERLVQTLIQAAGTPRSGRFRRITYQSHTDATNVVGKHRKYPYDPRGR